MSDQELVHAALSGNKNAASKLVERHLGYVYALVFKILQDREDAEECAHDALLKALKSLDGYRMESKFSTWLYRIAINTALSRRRKKTPVKHDLDQLANYAIDTESSRSELADRKRYLLLAMNSLDDEDSMLVTLYYFKELSIDEMAEIVQISKNNIKVKLYRARKKLGIRLEGLLKGEIKALL